MLISDIERAFTDYFMDTRVFEAFCDMLIAANTEILGYRLIMAYSQLLNDLDS